MPTVHQPAGEVDTFFVHRVSAEYRRSSTAVWPVATTTAVTMPGMTVGVVVEAGTALSGLVTARTRATRPSHCVGGVAATVGTCPESAIAPTATFAASPTSAATTA